MPNTPSVKTIRDEPQNPPASISIPAHIIRCPWLGSNAKVVWMVILSHADFKTRITTLSLESIITGSNLERRTVQRAIAELRGSGFLMVLERPKGKGSKSTRYRCVLPSKEVCQKRTSFHSLYTPSISGLSKDTEWYEHHEAGKVILLPVSSRKFNRYLNECLTGMADCNCGYCMKMDFTGFRTEEDIATAAKSPDTPDFTPIHPQNCPPTHQKPSHNPPDF